MIIRKYEQDDLLEIIQLFYDTVHHINIKDYNLEQIEAWTSSYNDLKYWQNKMHNSYCIVALMDQKIVGFANIEDNGYFDCLYVHYRYQNKGIGSRLCEAIEEYYRNKKFVHVSLTALSFFSKRGYKIIKKQSVYKDNIMLTNIVMEKD